MLTAKVIMPDGVVVTTEEGTPQGGPLSPLLSNIVLDELDWELEARGHRFVRYADDSNIYVCSERAGHRVMATVVRFIEGRLRLKVNDNKSAVAKPEDRHFVGFRLRRNCTLRFTDAHLRRRLRALLLRQWKRKRFIARRLIRMGNGRIPPGGSSMRGASLSGRSATAARSTTRWASSSSRSAGSCVGSPGTADPGGTGTRRHRWRHSPSAGAAPREAGAADIFGPGTVIAEAAVALLDRLEQPA
jgi:hypothetical protein